MKTTKDDRETFEELASAFVAYARELRVLREELKGRLNNPGGNA